MADDHNKDARDPKVKRPYARPRLVEYGSIETLTQGTKTTGKDGAAGGFKSPV